MNYGIDALAAARYPDLILKMLPKDWLCGVFTNVDGFRDALPFTRKLAKRGAAGMRLNFAWDDYHTFPVRKFQDIAHEAGRFAQVIKNHPSMKWYVSGATEHQLRYSEAARLSEMVMGMLPSSAIYVNNPREGYGATLPNTINEIHGHDAPITSTKFAYSFDGNDCLHENIKEMLMRRKGAEYFLLWCDECNGNKFLEPRKPRNKRTNWLTAQKLQAMINSV